MRHNRLTTFCDHRNMVIWKWDDVDNREHSFCLTCYARLTRDGWVDYEDDVPVSGLCEHRGDKEPLAKHTTAPNQQRALCKDCGCAVEHPDGPGSWKEVLFNGYLIEEEDERPEVRGARDRSLSGP